MGAVLLQRKEETRAVSLPAPAERARAQPDAAFLDIAGLRKTFDGAAVVKGLDLAIRKGEFVTILGPSGCGKTTTLRMIAGFIDANGGSIRLDGERIDKTPSHRRDTGMVFQSYALFPHLTVFENIAFGLRMRKAPPRVIAEKVAEALRLVQLPHLEGRYPAELSGGQQQRVALARAVVINPKLLLLDEPLSNLDAKLREELRSELVEIQREAGLTTLLVTHDLEEAFAVSDRIAVMNGGRLEQFARPYDIFNRPANAFVATFVGHTNILDGWGEGSASTSRFIVPTHALRMSRVSVKADTSVPAVLTRLSFRGSTIQFQVHIGSHSLRGETVVDGDVLALKAGDDVFVGWNHADVILLAADVE